MAFQVLSIFVEAGLSRKQYEIIRTAASKDFNNLFKTKVENIETFEFGLSILHARIRNSRVFITFVKKIPLKVWLIRLAESKKVAIVKKAAIQHQCGVKLRLIVDFF